MGLLISPTHFFLRVVPKKAVPSGLHDSCETLVDGYSVPTFTSLAEQDSPPCSSTRAAFVNYISRTPYISCMLQVQLCRGLFPNMFIAKPCGWWCGLVIQATETILTAWRDVQEIKRGSVKVQEPTSFPVPFTTLRDGNVTLCEGYISAAMIVTYSFLVSGAPKLCFVCPSFCTYSCSAGLCLYILRFFFTFFSLLFLLPWLACLCLSLCPDSTSSGGGACGYLKIRTVN